MSQKFGTRRKQAKEETRRIILETAYSLFEELGYEKATMRELASRAGVGIGTIFQHFRNKPALLVATFDEEMRPVVENAVSSIPPIGLKDQLRHLIRHVFEFYGCNGPTPLKSGLSLYSNSTLERLVEQVRTSDWHSVRYLCEFDAFHLV